jgi:hypothetical protein
VIGDYSGLLFLARQGTFSWQKCRRFAAQNGQLFDFLPVFPSFAAENSNSQLELASI